MNKKPLEESQKSNAVDPLSDSLRWALALGVDPSQSPIDWIAVELDPESNSAADAICRRIPEADSDLDRLQLLKSGFKSLRLSGETGSDRRVAARYYAATIAAAIASFETAMRKKPAANTTTGSGSAWKRARSWSSSFRGM